ncbi:hypothetical protein OAK19_05935, partial [Aureispira]|nr:hypothetical protein [Aureispira sp.]
AALDPGTWSSRFYPLIKTNQGFFPGGSGDGIETFPSDGGGAGGFLVPLFGRGDHQDGPWEVTSDLFEHGEPDMAAAVGDGSPVYLCGAGEMTSYKQWGAGGAGAKQECRSTYACIGAEPCDDDDADCWKNPGANPWAAPLKNSREYRSGNPMWDYLNEAYEKPGYGHWSGVGFPGRESDDSICTDYSECPAGTTCPSCKNPLAGCARGNPNIFQNNRNRGRRHCFCEPGFKITDVHEEIEEIKLATNYTVTDSSTLSCNNRPPYGARSGDSYPSNKTKFSGKAAESAMANAPGFWGDPFARLGSTYSKSGSLNYSCKPQLKPDSINKDKQDARQRQFSAMRGPGWNTKKMHKMWNDKYNHDATVNSIWTLPVDQLNHWMKKERCYKDKYSRGTITESSPSGANIGDGREICSGGIFDGASWEKMGQCVWDMDELDYNYAMHQVMPDWVGIDGDHFSIDDDGNPYIIGQSWGPYKLATSFREKKLEGPNPKSRGATSLNWTNTVEFEGEAKNGEKRKTLLTVKELIAGKKGPLLRCSKNSDCANYVVINQKGSLKNCAQSCDPSSPSCTKPCFPNSNDECDAKFTPWNNTQLLIEHGRRTAGWIQNSKWLENISPSSTSKSCYGDLIQKTDNDEETGEETGNICYFKPKVRCELRIGEAMGMIPPDTPVLTNSSTDNLPTHTSYRVEGGRRGFGDLVAATVSEDFYDNDNVPTDSVTEINPLYVTKSNPVKLTEKEVKTTSNSGAIGTNCKTGDESSKNMACKPIKSYCAVCDFPYWCPIQDPWAGLNMSKVTDKSPSSPASSLSTCYTQAKH